MPVLSDSACIGRLWTRLSERLGQRVSGKRRSGDGVENAAVAGREMAAMDSVHHDLADGFSLGGREQVDHAIDLCQQASLH
jgi:hypothetical protein